MEHAQSPNLEKLTDAVKAKPAGVYRVRDGEVEWRPAVDVNKLALGGQILVAAVAVAWAVSRFAR